MLKFPLKPTLIVLLSVIVLTIGCNVQRIDLKEAATIKSSYKMVKVTQGTTDSMIRAQYKNKTSMPNFYPERSDQFRVGDIAIKINGRKTKVEPGYLNTLKDILLNPLDKRSKVEISSIYGKQLLANMNSYEDLGRLFFMCVNKENTALITGLLYFRLTDERKAKAIFYDLIKNLKFNE